MKRKDILTRSLLIHCDENFNEFLVDFFIFRPRIEANATSVSHERNTKNGDNVSPNCSHSLLSKQFVDDNSREIVPNIWKRDVKRNVLVCCVSSFF